MGRKACRWCTNEDCAEDHVSHARSGTTEMILVNGPKPYIWVGFRERDDDESGRGPCGYVEGRAQLRRFAKAILRQLDLHTKGVTR